MSSSGSADNKRPEDLLDEYIEVLRDAGAFESLGSIAQAIAGIPPRAVPGLIWELRDVSGPLSDDRRQEFTELVRHMQTHGDSEDLQGYGPGARRNSSSVARTVA